MIFSFLLLLAKGVPVARCIAISSLLSMLISIPLLPALTTIAHRMATGLDSFTLLAIPFFILSGQLMDKGGIAHRLIAFAKALVGALPGGLALINVISAMLMGAIAGSAMASASAMGSILGPEMKREGYSCLLYTLDSADDMPCVDLAPRPNTQQKKSLQHTDKSNHRHTTHLV